MAAGSGTVHKLTVPERSGLCQVAKSIYYAGFKEDRRLGDDWPHGPPPRVCTVHELTVPQRSSPNLSITRVLEGIVGRMIAGSRTATACTGNYGLGVRSTRICYSKQMIGIKISEELIWISSWTS